jgi:4-hydroxythreonine-4-phosphate dehydrogenase
MGAGTHRPRIAITIGDYNGIGPEIVLRAIRHRSVRSACVPVLVGPAEAFAAAALRLGIPFRAERRPPAGLRSPADIPLLVDAAADGPLRIAPGRVSAAAGRTALLAILEAVRLARSGAVEAVVTAPVSKNAMHRAGVTSPGQTEILQKACRAQTVGMMLVTGDFRVGLITIHEPLSRVSRVLTPALLRRRLRVFHDALQRDWGIRRPRIAVLGLNPHAGEDGDLGREEITILRPVLTRLKAEGMRVEGPFPADAFFGRMDWRTWDLVAAMYHDQGLIPLKLIARGRGVNVTAGLPIIRTSPDHGTAFDIAARGGADPRSIIDAILLAARCARRRRRERASR